MRRILVMDDDETIRQALKSMLERAGYEVALAENGEEGLKLFREQPADLIITDIRMPGKDGWDAIAELKLEFPMAKIIAMSGGGRVGGPFSYLKVAERLGAERVFPKPLRRSVLLTAVEELIGG